MRLAVKYRPHCFGEVVGQRATRAVLHGMAQRKAMPAALLFYGAYGSGKTTSARILAAALNCEQPNGSASAWPCGACPSCKAVANGTSLDVIEVDAASNGTVDEVRKICELVQYGTTGQWRVVILDEAQSMSRDAFNTLLKRLEEPLPHVVFILVTTERGKILPTVVSRCTPFAFTRLPVAAIAKRLRQVADAEGLAVTDELLAHLADRSRGAMRDALNKLEQAASVNICTLPAWQELTSEEDFAPRLLAAATAGNHVQAYAELDQALLTCSDYSELVSALVNCLCDVLVLGAGGEVTAQGEALEARRNLAEGLEAQRVVKAMGVLWDLQVKYRNADRPAGLQLAVALLTEKLCPPLQHVAGRADGSLSTVSAEFMATLEDFTS